MSAVLTNDVGRCLGCWALGDAGFRVDLGGTFGRRARKARRRIDMFEPPIVVSATALANAGYAASGIITRLY